MCYFKDGVERRIYFDSFGQTTPAEIQKYLINKKEYETGKAVIQRNTDIVQHVNTHVCVHLYTDSLTCKHQQLNDGYTQGDWQTPATEEGFCSTISQVYSIA